MAHGRELWDFALVDPELNKVSNDGMECTARITIKALISEYKHGFDCIGSLVDVGGDTGASIAEIVKAYPHIKGTNFDLPHVVATAPPCPGVNHIGGDMFSNILTTDAIFLKCALDAGIANIIQARNYLIMLSQIANDVASSPSLDITHLSRLMRFLVHKKLFDTTNPQSDSNSKAETLYSLNHCSKWLLRDPQQLSLAPFLCLLQYHRTI
ncbi:hypothetical protein TEA_019140 [Camellia sinensis var. sinensis]|uniref:O-methyltransferase C-terminal domain-containing protein n=1 Tax=Camellia sinensis var. sinensis TaxID=542762 RepID=A0A4S4EQZ4_CAMSN|nr:hypothetical protein TEA_019140 [Camellia sinensis var. sinensis]